MNIDLFSAFDPLSQLHQPAISILSPENNPMELEQPEIPAQDKQDNNQEYKRKVREFEILHEKEDCGCVHEVFLPKEYERKSI